LAELVQQVYSVEIIGALASAADERLHELGYGNVTVRHGDGYQAGPNMRPSTASSLLRRRRTFRRRWSSS